MTKPFTSEAFEIDEIDEIDDLDDLVSDKPGNAYKPDALIYDSVLNANPAPLPRPHDLLASGWWYGTSSIRVTEWVCAKCGEVVAPGDVGESCG